MISDLILPLQARLFVRYCSCCQAPGSRFRLIHCCPQVVSRCPSASASGILRSAAAAPARGWARTGQRAPLPAAPAGHHLSLAMPARFAAAAAGAQECCEGRLHERALAAQSAAASCCVLHQAWCESAEVVGVLQQFVAARRVTWRWRSSQTPRIRFTSECRRGGGCSMGSAAAGCIATCRQVWPCVAADCCNIAH